MWHPPLGTPVRRFAATLLASFLVVSVVSFLMPARGGVRAAAEATAFQVNPAHTGYSRAAIAPPLHRRWSRLFDGSVSYALIADGKVFVSVLTEAGRWSVKALGAGAGATLWSRPFPPHVVGTALHGDTLFVQGSDGTLTALRIDSGRVRWRTSLYREGEAYDFDSAPTAWRGRVYVSAGGYGGHVFGVDAGTGALLWHQRVRGGGSSPAAGDGAVYVAFPAPQVYGLDARFGSVRWHVGAFPHGGGGFVTTYYRGRLYAPGRTGLVVDSDTGRLVDAYWGEAQPAVHDDTLLMLENGQLHAMNREDHAHRWLFKSPDGSKLATSPLIVNGRGYVASAGGVLYALGLRAGRVLWRDELGSGVWPSRNIFLGGPMVGMTAGRGLLVVPAKNRLVAYAD